MQKSIVGKIWEERNEGKIVYFVSIFDDRILKFKELKDTLEFVKYNMQSFFEFEEIPKVNMEYTNIDGISHFIVFRRGGNDKDITIYEQSMFDYMRTNPHNYKPFARRRVINDSNYTFSDILRSAINWSPSYSVYVMLISIILFISSAFLIVFGLDYADVLKKTRFHLDTVWSQVLLFSILGMNLLLTAYMAIGMFRSRNKLFKTTGDYQEINWLKWYRRRMFVHSLMFISSASAITIMSFYAYELRNEQSDAAFTPILYTNMFIWSLFALTTLFIMFSAVIRQESNLRKYFSGKDIKKYRRWKRNQNNEEVSLQNKDIFIFPTKASEASVRNDIDFAQEALLNMSKEDRKMMYRTENKVLETTLKEYNSYIRKNKYVNL